MPHDKLTTLYKGQRTSRSRLFIANQIAHFFENYKDLEAGKWVKVDGWRGADAARNAVIASVEAEKIISLGKQSAQIRNGCVCSCD